MRKFLLAAVLSAAFSAPPIAAEAPKLLTPSDIVASSPASDWRRIAPKDLLVMDLAPDAAGKPRRVVIQLISAPFSQGWVDNIRKLVAARWYDGIAVVRVQDNYVAQWGDPDGEVAGKAKALPAGLKVMKDGDYAVADKSVVAAYSAGAKLKDSYASVASFRDGWPFAGSLQAIWPIHCYGAVGVGRNLSPDAGTGAELYAVIGHAPRQLDRNVAVVGRVIEGIENLSALPRGTGPLGFYEDPAQRVKLVSVRMGDEVPGLPPYEYLSTESQSFAAYAGKRANRKDDFYIQPAGGVDICNLPVPIRVVKP
ncbi:peptidylprolyl isomerase [Novosphingobium sp. PhB165]|uniref:peptidylprolyl isomerase n=1 Tax=Novosphingobium sp. PhB165 TaxID=2485105 RepID=UPI00104A4B9F|nr:peptidylprolyl isomerase [Novosphingobium sp. PhB165]TCM19038.1 peptidylprolyl isomerase [Novosphingobium sp. PhB165]